MILPLDFKTLTLALRIARRLTGGSTSPEGLSLLRELLAGLVNSKQALAYIEAWLASGPGSAPSDAIVRYCSKLPDIIETFAASGYGAEAVRVMATGAGLVPMMSNQLFNAARDALVSTTAVTKSEKSVAAAQQLVNVGKGVLETGNPEGIVLMGAAHMVAPEVEIPFQEIAASIDHLPDRQPSSLDLGEAQELTNAAYALHFKGLEEPAVRIGALLPAMVSARSAKHLFDRLQSTARPGAKAAFEASRKIFDKGYAAPAANLLVDSGAVSAEDMWASLHEEIRDPDFELKAPGKPGLAFRAFKQLVTTARVDPPGPSFFFALEGEGTRCNEALWGKSFELVFRYDMLPSEAAAALEGKKLTTLVQSTATVVFGVDVIPKGLTLKDGGAGRIAKFENGKMVSEAPRFTLQAPEKSDAPPDPPRGFYAVFTVSGAVIYTVFVEIRLVEQLADGPCSPQILDLDPDGIAAIKVEESRVARIKITREGGPWRVEGVVDDVDLKSGLTEEIDFNSLNNAYETSIIDDIKKIAGDAAWRFVDKNLDVPADQQEAALACMKRAAMAGSRLYRRFSQDTVFKNMLEEIEKLPDGSKITVVTDNTVFPWELFYPLSYIDEFPPENYQPDKFWGRRFLFESLLISYTKDEKLPATRQQTGKLYVSMGLNCGIDDEQPWKGRPPGPAKLQKDYFDSSLKDRSAYFDDYSEILGTIVRRPNSASLIYFFCHGTADQLQFEPQKQKLTADHLNPCPNYPGWPIVFVNACDAGNISPLSFFSFRTEFRKRKAAGLIAPSFPIPTMFAAMFANAFLTAYTNRQLVGRILFNLRRELLAKNNPLGLWYSLQCPLDVKAPEH